MNNKIKNIITYLFFFLPILLWGQASPAWMNSKWRSLHFPVSSYYSYFIDGSVNESTLEELKEKARSNLTKNISVRIKNETTISDESTLITSKNKVNTTSRYNNTLGVKEIIELSNDLEIAGINIESYFDKKKQKQYAFAYVKRQDLINYYTRQINHKLQEIEEIPNTATEWKNSYDKIEIIRKCKTAFAKIDYYQELLVIVADNNDKILSEKIQLLKQRYNQLLKQNIFIYISNDEFFLGNQCNIISEQVKNNLTANGWIIEKMNEQDADFSLHIRAKSRKGDFTPNPHIYYYTDVTAELTDIKTGKSIFLSIDVTDTKAGGSTHESAAHKAFNKAAVQIIEALEPYIKTKE